MKVLWITNILFPEAQALLQGEAVLKASGGWMLGAAEALLQQPDIELAVATVSRQVKSLRKVEGKRITYYLLPYGKGNIKINHDYEPLWIKVNKDIKPDIVHIHGTEFTHGLAYMQACGTKNVCVSIQGLISACSYYYYYGLPLRDILFSHTLSSIVKGGILRSYYDFKKRGKYEKEMLCRTHYIIGRTSWDCQKVWAINPNACYYYGGETLRNCFYSGDVWDYCQCEKHSIFISQASYPLKGLHMVLRAMPLILRHYPDTTLRIAGYDISRSKGGKEILKISDYGLIIRRLINRYNLQDKLTFLGLLDSNNMRREYLRSNVFLCPSSVENSPNSLGEAQILGVPVIASYAGGIPDMMKGDEEHLYRFEEVEMLAYKVVEIFSKSHEIDTSKMRIKAMRRHDARKNVSDLMETYKAIMAVS